MYETDRYNALATIRHLRPVKVCIFQNGMGQIGRFGVGI
jgi:hypothetical protein